MKNTDFETVMRSLEHFHGLRVPTGAFTIIRIDGRSFSRFTEDLEKPFDLEFQGWMEATTRKLVENLGAIYGYHESDEISLLFARDMDLFDREVEKLCSVSASLASVAFYQALIGSQLGAELLFDKLPHFDSRVIVAVDQDQVLDYFSWRMADAGRCCLNGYCHWTAIQKDGLSATRAGSLFQSKPQSFKHEFLFQRGINFTELPLWQRRGTMHYWGWYLKQGFNPQTQAVTEVKRRRVMMNKSPEQGDYYRTFLKILIEHGQVCGEAP